MLRKIFVFVLCLVMGFMLVAPAMADASANSVITYRDGAEWWAAQYSQPPYGTNDRVVAFRDPENNMTILVNYGAVFFTLEKSDSALPDPIIDIMVKERALPDGRAVITVIETGSNAPATVYNQLDFYANFPSDPVPLVVGAPGDYTWSLGQETVYTDLLVDYAYMVKFYMDQGAPLPHRNDIPPTDLISVTFLCNGTGTLSNRAEYYGYTSGEKAMVSVNQRGSTISGEGDPGMESWPVEHVIIKEIGK